jgi:hypothetical protein
VGISHSAVVTAVPEAAVSSSWRRVVIRDEHARAVRGSLLILVGIVVGIVSYGTWAVRTYDFGAREAVHGMDVGGSITLAHAVIVLGAGLGSLFGVDVVRWVALVTGSVTLIYSVVRAAQLGAEDFPLGYTTEVAGALWIGIAACALTIPVALARARSIPMRSAHAEPTGLESFRGRA